MSTLHLHAPAKLNLALSVGPPAPPKNYHPIASLFVAINLHDDIELSHGHPGTPSTYTIEWAPDAPRPSPIDWPIEKDLAVRAHRLLEKHVGCELPVIMRMRKRIPVGAGLGGGSSDAAAMLSGVNTLFSLGLSAPTLAELSTALGSDVAFFLDAPRIRPALVTGFGETVERLPLTLTRQSALLIMPPFGCPTGPVYQAFDAHARAEVDHPRVRAIAKDAGASGTIDPHALFNDLADAACAVRPELQGMLARLSAALGPEHPVHVTGSGSTLFMIADDDRARSLVDAAGRACPEAACRLCRFA